MIHRLRAKLFEHDDWRTALLWGAIATLTSRIVLGLVMACSWLVVRPYLSEDLLNNPSVTDGLPVYHSILVEAILGVWRRWDAVHHLNLARLGYFGVDAGKSVFYPLYSSLTAIISPLVGRDYLFAGLLVSTFSAVVSFSGMYVLANHLYSPKTARYSLFALSTFPTAFFLIAPYTESLYLALTLVAFIFAYRRRWLLAGLLAALASLTRGPGILNLFPLGVIALRQWFSSSTEDRSLTKLVAPATAMLLCAAGGLAYQAWRLFAGFPSTILTWRQYTKMEWVGPVRGAQYALTQLFAGPEFLTVLEFLCILVFVALTLGMLIRPRWRHTEWIVFMFANLFLLSGLHALEASAWRSSARYVLVLFPGFIVIGDILAKSRPTIRFIYLFFSSAALISLSALFAVYWFIG